MISQRSIDPRDQPRAGDVRPGGSAIGVGGGGVGTLTLLDRVEDRDRAVLAMLLERVHPDDIAATLGVSAATLRRRRAQIIARLRGSPKPGASVARVWGGARQAVPTVARDEPVEVETAAIAVVDSG